MLLRNHVMKWNIVLAAFLLLVLQGCMQGVLRQDNELVDLENAVKANPDDLNSIGNLADGYQKRYLLTRESRYRDKAIEQYRIYIQHSPRHPGASVALYQLLMGKAVGEKNKGYLSELRNLYENTIILGELGLFPPSSIEAIIKLTRTRVGEDTLPVIKLLKKGLKENPGNVGTLILLSELYHAKGQYEIALNVIKQAVDAASEEQKDKVLPQLGKMLNAVAYDRRCERPNPYFDEALVQIKAALAVKPENPELELALADIYSHKEQYHLSLFTIKRLYDRQPNPYHKMQLADHYWFAGENKKALEYYSQLYQNRLFGSDALKQTARLHFGEADWEKSREFFQRHIDSESKPDFYPTLMHALTIERTSVPGSGLALLRGIQKSNLKKEWEGILLDYHLDRISDQQLLEKAGNVCEQTEAHYFLGLRHLYAGNEKRAKTAFQKVVDLKFPLFIEYRFAKIQLERMGL